MSASDTTPQTTVVEVSLVVPVYNEAPNLHRVIGLFTSAAAAGAEVVFVDDGSTDGTGQVLEQAGFIVKRLDEHAGFGAAVKAGLATSRGAVIVWLPGSGRVEPLTALALGTALFRSDPAKETFIKASRRGRPWQEQLRTLLSGLLLSLTSGRNLMESGGTPTAIHRAYVDRLREGPDDLLFEIYTLWKLRASGLRRVAYPVHFGPRLAGVSRWNRGLGSQIRLLCRQLRAVTRWRRDLGAN